MVLSNSDFVHWHNHSEYSTFDGLNKISDLAHEARKMGMPAIALTDHGNVSGWIKFIAECSATKDKEGNEIPYDPIKPILGCEFYLARKQEWKSKNDAKENGGFQTDGRKGNRHLSLHAMNFKGYQNLCELSGKSWTNGFYFDPRIDIELLAEHSEGLICGSACLSSVINANLLHDRYDQAKKSVALFKDIFEDNFFLEAMYHGLSDQRVILPDIFKLAAEMDVPVLATNDCHYLKKKHALSQEVLMCNSIHKCMTDPSHLRHSFSELYFKSAPEMEKIFGHVPQTLTNTVALAERVDSEDIEKNLFGGMRLPKFELPKEFDTPKAYLLHLAKQGMKKLGWDKSKVHVEALKKELRDVQVAKDSNNFDFATYFLIVWDYVNYARENNIVTGCGRGSGYASVLLRCLGITYGPDPLQYGLLWERFLGFDTKRFVNASDFGLSESKDLVEALENAEGDDAAREVENDLGGVDRY